MIRTLLRRPLLAALLLLPLLTVPLHAEVYYVRTGGNDGNSGTSWSQAFATLGRAATAVNGGAGGDVIAVEATGLYREAITLTSDCSLFAIEVADSLSLTPSIRGFTLAEPNLSSYDFLLQADGAVVTVTGVTLHGDIDGNGSSTDAYVLAQALNGGVLNLKQCQLYKGDFGLRAISDGEVFATDCTLSSSRVAAVRAYHAGTSITLQRCVVSDSPTGLLCNPSGRFELDHVTVQRCGLGLEFSASSSGGSSILTHLTVVQCDTGLTYSTTDTVVIYDSIVALNEAGLHRSGGGPLIASHLILYNIVSNLSGLSAATVRLRNPHFLGPDRDDYRFQPYSPARFGARDGGYLGAWKPISVTAQGWSRPGWNGSPFGRN